MANNSEDMDRKIYRHKRRVRNQAIAYIVLFIILAGLVAGGIIGIRKVMQIINDKKQAQELQKQLEELSESEDDQATVEAPVDEPLPEEGNVDWLEEIVTPYIAEMNLESKVAGLFMITPEELTGTATVIRAGDTTREKLSEFPVGGLIYFSHNIQDEAQLTEMLQNTQNFQGPMFLGIDEEGGIVSRVADSGLAENVGSAADIAASGDAQAARDANAVKLDESMLSEAEKKMVDDFSKKIDVTDSNLVLNYGAAAQKNIAAFSESALNNVKTKDLGEVGEALSSLVVELKTFGQPEKKGIGGFFQKKRNELEAMKASYSKAEVNVDKIVKVLENHQVTLMKDVAMFDQMYELNTKYYKELTMYILAGKKRLEYLRSNDLAELKKKAEATGAQEDAQAYNDFANLCNRFEKKLHDLELTRMISIQMGPQTRLLQNNDTQMLEKIQSSLVNTIPLWKSQMVLALGLEHSRQATAAQSAVTNMTNDLLKKNAEMLKMGTIETAKEAERSIVDIETLQHTNQQLISTLDEVIQIQRDGAQKRREAEVELGRIEGELKQKLMELRG